VRKMRHNVPTSNTLLAESPNEKRLQVLRVVGAEHSRETSTFFRGQAVESKCGILPHDVVDTVERTTHAAFTRVTGHPPSHLVLRNPDELVAAKCRPNGLDLIQVHLFLRQVVQKQVPVNGLLC
jgi:hypothetical protein